MCTKKKSNKSTHLCEDGIVKVKAQKRSVCTIERPRSSMVEEEGSLVATSTKSEKDTSNSEYLLETLAVEKDEDEDIDVSRKVATPRAITSTMKEVNKSILICVYSC
jgi:hypothetical protein